MLMQFNHVPMDTWGWVGGGSKQGLCGVISSSTGLPQPQDKEEDLARNEDRKEMIRNKKHLFSNKYSTPCLQLCSIRTGELHITTWRGA